MNISSALHRLPEPAARAAVTLINHIGPVRRLASRVMINHFSYLAPARPRAVSMAADYTTWDGLTNRQYSGRNLPPPLPHEKPAHPCLKDVLALFERREMRYADDTSLLFPLFAQWFTDSFLRTKWESGPEKYYRENESNHEIDLIQIYGMTAAQTRMLRDPNRKGRLRSERGGPHHEEWPVRLFAPEDGKVVIAPEFRETSDRPTGLLRQSLYSAVNFERVFNDKDRPWTDEQKQWAFASGLEHGSSTLGNVTMNTLFLREHNRIADILARKHTDWDSDRVFHTTRNVLIVILLNIVIGDYIGHIAPLDFQLEPIPGAAEKEHWYRNNWMTVEFALLYRWHDLIPDEFTIGGIKHPSTQMVRAGKLLVNAGLGEVLRSASSERAGRIGLGNTAQWLLPLVKPQSIEMGRRCNLASYNAYRRHYRLKPVKSFEELTGELALNRTGRETLASKLRKLYVTVDRLEWFVGIFAEGYGKRRMMGDLMLAMVAHDAFTQALTNPLMAKAVFNEQTFSEEGMEIIKNTRRLSQVIERNTGMAEHQFGFKVRDRIS